MATCAITPEAQQCGVYMAKEVPSEGDKTLARLYIRHGEIYVNETVLNTSLVEIRHLIDIPRLKDHLLKHQVIGRKQLDEITNHYHSRDDQVDNLLKCVGCAGGKHGYFLLYVSLCESSEKHRGHEDAVHELKKKAKELEVVAPESILRAGHMLQQQELKHDEESSAGEAEIAESGYESDKKHLTCKCSSKDKADLEDESNKKRSSYKCSSGGDCTIYDYIKGSECCMSAKNGFHSLFLPKSSYEELQFDLTLSKQSEVLLEKFADVAVNTFEGLSKIAFEDAQRYTNHLVSTGIYDSAVFNRQPITNCISETTSHKELEKELMENYYSWFNFGMIKNLRKKFLFKNGDDELMQSYEDVFSLYCRRRCFESPLSFHPRPVSTNLKSLVFKTDANYGKYTLLQARKITVTVASIINSPDHAIYVESVKEGCVEVSCYILPQFGLERLNDLQISQLKENNIFSFKIEDKELMPQCQYHLEQHESTSDPEGYDASCEKESDSEDKPSSKEGTCEAVINKADKYFDIALREEGSSDICGRSISPNEAGMGDDIPPSASQMYDPDEIDSGSSTPLSLVSSCSELILALESVMADLIASQAEIEDNVTADSAIAEETEPITMTTSEVSEVKRDVYLEKAPSHDLGKAWKTDLAEKEKLLNECKNQIKSPLKRWPTNTKGNIYDILKPMNLDDVYSEPREIINALLESERRYISGLSLLHTQFEEPIKMLAHFKPDVLCSHQINYLFLNCSELLLLHRSFYEELCDISSMTSQTAQVDKLLEVCERVFQSFSIYSPFMDSSRRQNIQKEIKHLGQKPQFTQLLVHCQKACKDVNFIDLLMLPTERLNKYSDFLKHFLDPRVRALPEDATKRVEAIIRFLKSLHYSIQESQRAHEQPEAEEFCLYPADFGPKIAAASLEKLFQQLISPQIFREDFTDVFLLTHSCFTTPKDVLTALVNCVKSYEDHMSDTSSQASGNFAFPFSMEGMLSGDSGPDPYSRLIPRERVHVGEGEECDGDDTPRNMSMSSTGGGNVPQVYLQLKGGVTTLAPDTPHSKNMFQELDESSHMLDMLIESLRDFKRKPPTPPASSAHEKRRLSHSVSNLSSVFSESEDQEHLARMQEAAANGVKTRSCTWSENATWNQLVSSLSTSEPDLVNIDEPTSHEIRSHDLTVGNRMVRGSSEHSLLTASLNIEHRSPFHHGNAMLTAPAQQTRSALSTPERKKYSNTIESSGSRTPKKLSVGKKSSTFRRYSPSSDGPECGSKGSKKGKTTSRLVGVKHKFSKTFKQSPSMEVKEMANLPRETRSQSIPTIRRNNMGGSMTRKTSVEPELLSVAVDVPDGAGPSPSRRQRTLISNIFTVLGCWQENYYEDFETDDELRKLLEDFLQNIIDKSRTDTLEYFGALTLLESMSNRKIRPGEDPSRPPTFSELLQRVTKLKPEMLEMYDWEHPDKLMAGEQIDLGRSHPMDSMFLKVIAEQLTLMEFAVYAAVQRRELLKCAWKKPDKETQAPNLCRLIRRTNEMTSWVTTEILSRETPSQRARVIENFVQIAYYCYSHNDFHCALNITIALQSACIKGLKRTWDEVKKKYKSRLKKLRTQVDYNGRCKKLREKLEKITEESLQRTNKLPNALPYIGAYLDQIYTLEMNSKTYNPDGLVNFAKMTKLAQMIQNMLQYQRSHFGFEPKLTVMTYVTAAKCHSENKLYELSAKLKLHCH